MLLVRNLVTGTGKVNSTTLLDRRIGRIEELDGLLKVALALAKQALRLSRVGTRDKSGTCKDRTNTREPGKASQGETADQVDTTR